jgi:hypothetical protein
MCEAWKRPLLSVVSNTVNLPLLRLRESQRIGCDAALLTVA